MTNPETGSDATEIAGVIARPPLIYAGFLALGFALDALWPTSLPIVASRTSLAVAGLALIVAAAAIFTMAVLRMTRTGTNVPTTQPTTALVTDGIFARTRNPIYLAMTLAYAGIALADDNSWALGLLVPVLALIQWGVIHREERYLARKFGADYRQYRARVRRWL